MKKNKSFHLFCYRGVFSIIFYFALIALLWYLIIPHTSLYYYNSAFNPFFDKLNTEDITLVKGESFKLHLVGINRKASYSSSDIKVASVNIFGNVYALRPGTTFIKVKHNKKIYKCRVRVIAISKKSIELKVGKSYDLDVKKVHFNIKWYSSNKKIVKVNSHGKVTAISKGTAVIYAKVDGKKVSCKIKVK